jgi:paraquat-inducible protein B
MDGLGEGLRRSVLDASVARLRWRYLSWVWLLPLAAAAMPAWLGYASWAGAGHAITVVRDQAGPIWPAPIPPHSRRTER